MKKFIFFVLIFIMVAFLGFSQSEEDREVARTQDYISAATLQGAAKIKALQAYIKKFPDVKQKWTRYAYYSLTTELFQTKNYAEAVKYAKKTLEIGVPGEGGEEGRLYLILGNSYGVRSDTIFNREEALKYTDKAISFASEKSLQDVLEEAKKLKKSLSGPPPVQLTPEQKIKRAVSNGDYGEATAIYKGMSTGDKENVEIKKVYALALFKNKNYDSALTEYKALYNCDKKGTYASRIAEIYEIKAKSNKSLLDTAIDYYLEAGLLYKKEQSSSNEKASFGKARYEIYEKYGFNKKIEDYNKKQKQNLSAAKKNVDEIERLKRELRKHERYLRKTYERNNVDPPGYELEKSDKFKKRIAALESGGTGGSSSDEGAKLEEERNRIEKELNDLLAQAKKRLNL